MTNQPTTDTTTDTTIGDTMTDTTFYTPPALPEHHQPGDILRLRPTSTPRLPGAGQAWQILYVSRDSHGDPIPVSGTVIAPEGTTQEPSPTLVYHPSFHGLGGDCAPSQLLAAGQEPDTHQISAVLARRWRVALVDGEGLGVIGHGPHTFLAGHASAHVVLDMARAARAIPALHAAHAPTLLWGYADGGRAAIMAGELHADYAPELDIRGIAAGAVVTDPGEIARCLDGSPWSALGIAGLIGLAHAHRHLPLRHVLTDSARALLAEAETSSMPELCQRYPDPISAWCERPDPWNDPMWRHVLAHELTSASLIPAAPVYLYHGRGDTVVPIRFGRNLFKDYRNRGAQARWCEYDANHFGTALEATDDVLAYLADNLTSSIAPAAGRAARP